MEDFTPEQLAKPDLNYAQMLDQILQPHGKTMYPLQQIYKVIQRTWPYYKFGVTGDGWKSSVRHNLTDTPAFVQHGGTGKGSHWERD
ncbi:winged helix DNA-binding domain-containing protein, partial [Aulographum hederae CBS 113979]